MCPLIFILMVYLSREFSRLPEINVLLTGKLIKFFRKIITCPYYPDQQLKKATAFALIKYFAPSIFFRPFRPGNVSVLDKQYHPLLLFLIIKWPLIQKFSATYKAEYVPKKLHFIPEVHSSFEEDLQDIYGRDKENEVSSDLEKQFPTLNLSDQNLIKRNSLGCDVKGQNLERKLSKQNLSNQRGNIQDADEDELHEGYQNDLNKSNCYLGEENQDEGEQDENNLDEVNKDEGNQDNSSENSGNQNVTKNALKNQNGDDLQTQKNAVECQPAKNHSMQLSHAKKSSSKLLATIKKSVGQLPAKKLSTTFLSSKNRCSSQDHAINRQSLDQSAINQNPLEQCANIQLSSKRYSLDKIPIKADKNQIKPDRNYIKRDSFGIKQDSLYANAMKRYSSPSRIHTFEKYSLENSACENHNTPEKHSKQAHEKHSQKQNIINYDATHVTTTEETSCASNEEDCIINNTLVATATQTSLDYVHDLNLPLIRLVPYIYYYDTDEYLKDFSCQTDPELTQRMSGDYQDIECTCTYNYKSGDSYDNYEAAPVIDGSYVKYDKIDIDFHRHSNSSQNSDNSEIFLSTFQQYPECGQDNPKPKSKYHYGFKEFKNNQEIEVSCEGEQKYDSNTKYIEQFWERQHKCRHNWKLNGKLCLNKPIDEDFQNCDNLQTFKLEQQHKQKFERNLKPTHEPNEKYDQKLKYNKISKYKQNPKFEHSPKYEQNSTLQSARYDKNLKYVQNLTFQNAKCEQNVRCDHFNQNEKYDRNQNENQIENLKYNENLKCDQTSKRHLKQPKLNTYKEKISHQANECYTFQTYDQNQNGIYGWVYSLSSDVSDSELPCNTSKAESDGYIYDEYNNFQFDECTSSHNLIDPKSNSIINRISKIGWTYSPNLTKHKKMSIEETKENIKKKYKLFYLEEKDTRVSVEKDCCLSDEKETHINAEKEAYFTEEKEKCSSCKLEDAPCSTEVDMVKSTNKRLSLTNISNKIAARLDLKKLFVNKREILENSASADQISSKIKYKKMESAKSSLF